MTESSQGDGQIRKDDCRHLHAEINHRVYSNLNGRGDGEQGKLDLATHATRAPGSGQDQKERREHRERRRPAQVHDELEIVAVARVKKAPTDASRKARNALSKAPQP